MKIIYKFSLILIILIVAISCSEEEMINPDPIFTLSFQREGETDALAGTMFYVILDGSGEFFTLYNGSKGHIWGEEGDRGIDFNNADSLGVSYKEAGKYNLTIVTSSTGNFGKDFSRDFKTVELNVIDQRNSFTNFEINGIDGVFAPDNEILFTVPDAVTNFNFVAEFKLDSKTSTVSINGVEQSTGVTVNDFSQPVVYVIKSLSGEEHQYTVKFSTFPSLDEKSILTYVLGKGGNDEAAVIDETTKTIHLDVNYGTDLEAVRLVLESSYGSQIYLNNTLYSSTVKYNLITTKTLKVVAQNNSEVDYTLETTVENPVSQFAFAGLIPSPSGVIDLESKTITVYVLKETDITNLAASWNGTLGKVTVGTVEQENGITPNDFTNSVTYTFYKGTTEGDKYNVIVNYL